MLSRVRRITLGHSPTDIGTPLLLGRGKSAPVGEGVNGALLSQTASGGLEGVI